jgi:A/G-specific adenine glycosylase
MQLGSEIIKWYKVNKRDLPWRNTRNPYHIWLSEIILQQTRVDQGLSYYHRFVEKYPTVKALASAKESEVLRLWQGLGYYTRARNLHKTARTIAENFKGRFPKEYEEIRSLAGVGEYTAAAIASFAYDLKYPVVDGNVFRVLSRYFGIKTPIDTSSGKKVFSKLAGKLMAEFPPAQFNQAIMEFGSRQCRPSNPDCLACPLNGSCFSFLNKKINSFPVKKNKTRVRNRFFHYLVIRYRNSFYIRKRLEKDIWQGLHDFPLIETEKRTTEEEILNSPEWKKILSGKKAKLIHVSPNHKHLLSHQEIHARFYEISIEKRIVLKEQKKWKLVNLNSVKKHALPRLIERYVEKLSQVPGPKSQV